MKMTPLLGTAMLLFAAKPAAACLPVLPGTEEPPPPSPEESARRIHSWASDIVYGVVTRTEDDDGRYRFRILHVYKGKLRPGRTIDATASFGFDWPGCRTGSPPPLLRGDYGVIAFGGDNPELNFVADETVQAMFDAGLIASARRSPP